MRETIYTIPIVDGFKAENQCPFCAMEKKLEDDFLQILSNSAYMENDIRNLTNLQGFCEKHLNKLYENKNMLGLALMLHTHLQTVTKSLEKTPKDVSTYFEKLVHSCYLCEKIDKQMDKYFDVYFALWKKEDNIKEMTKSCNGFCFKHFSCLLKIGGEYLKSSKLEEFYGIILNVQKTSINKFEEEVDWFIKKFDYRYKDEPWKNSKDCVLRITQRVR